MWSSVLSRDRSVSRLALRRPTSRRHMLAEYAVLEEDGIVKLPGHLSLEEGATLPCAGVTVWNAMMEHAKLIAGQTVLLEGTGGVSIFGLQLAGRPRCRTPCMRLAGSDTSRSPSARNAAPRTFQMW